MVHLVSEHVAPGLAPRHCSVNAELSIPAAVSTANSLSSQGPKEVFLLPG